MSSWWTSGSVAVLVVAAAGVDQDRLAVELDHPRVDREGHEAGLGIGVDLVGLVVPGRAGASCRRRWCPAAGSAAAPGCPSRAPCGCACARARSASLLSPAGCSSRSREPFGGCDAAGQWRCGLPGPRQRHGRRRDRRGAQARGRRDRLRLSAQPDARGRRADRHPHGDRAPGAHRAAHGRRGQPHDQGRADGRVRDAAGAGGGERLRRRRAGLCRQRAGAGHAAGLCAGAGARAVQLQLGALDGERRQACRAADQRRATSCR